MFWKIIATLILAALIKKGLLGILLSYNFLMDGDLARYSPILKERFPSGFFILTDTLNLTANLLIFIWSALYIAAMWLDGIISPTPLVVLSVAGMSVSLLAIPMNRKIKTELYDSVTKFKYISDLPDDVRPLSESDIPYIYGLMSDYETAARTGFRPMGSSSEAEGFVRRGLRAGNVCGLSSAGSPVWADSSEYCSPADSLPGYFQVVGHSYNPSDPTEQGDHLLCLDCARPFLLEPDDTEIGSFGFKWA